MRLAHAISIFAALTLPLSAQPHCRPSQGFSRPMVRVSVGSSTPSTSCHRPSAGSPAVHRPSATPSGTPVRWVNAPRPACSTNFVSNYGYGYGGYGYSGYGYGGSGYSFGVNPSVSYPTPRTTSYRSRSSAQPPDPRSARNYLYAKAISAFSSENSVAGKLYLKQDAITWFLVFDGAAEYSDQKAVVPCLAYVSGDERKRPVDLVLTIREGKVVSSTIEIKNSKSR